MIGAAPTGGHVRVRDMAPLSPRGVVAVTTRGDLPEGYQALGPPPTTVFQMPGNDPVTAI
jgi:hypothetical protein